jgi:hypothetical protein
LFIALGKSNYSGAVAYVCVGFKASWLPYVSIVEDLGQALRVQLKHGSTGLGNLHLVLQAVHSTAAAAAAHAMQYATSALSCELHANIQVNKPWALLNPAEYRP